MNSFILLISFLAFILFGYVTLGRMSYKFLFREELGQPILFDKRLLLSTLSQLGFSTLFYAMPTISIALFWGWLPALLWLLIAHLIAEFLFNTQLSYSIQDEDKPGHALYTLYEAENLWSSTLVKFLVQCYTILIFAIGLTYIVKLLDINSGLMFCLLALIPAQGILQKNQTSKRFSVFIVLSILSLWIGLVLGHHIGLTFHGNWTPWPEALPWFSANHATLNSIILVCLINYLQKKTAFRQDLSYLCGGIAVILVCLFIAKLAWLRPIIDAPMQSDTNITPKLPWFIGICAFLLIGGVSSALRLFIPYQPSPRGLIANRTITSNLSSSKTPNHRNDFFCYQTSSLLVLLFMVCLLTIMAAAIGIGAWDTHYLNWSGSQNMIDHWRLVIDSLLSLLSSSNEASWINTLFTCVLAYLGFCTLLFIKSTLIEVSQLNDDRNPFLSQANASPIAQSALLCLVSLILIEYGISVHLWLFIGMIGWLLLCAHICRSTLENSSNQLVFSVFSLAMIGLGLLQIMLLSFYWIKNSQVLLGLLGLALLPASVILLYRDGKEIVSKLSETKEEKLFE